MRRAMVSVCVLAVGLSGCARWVLPSESAGKVAVPGMETYAESQAVFTRITPFETTAADLSSMGIHPGITPNLRLANYLEVRQRFMPLENVSLKDLDPAVQACVNARDACEAWVLDLEQIERQRVGHVSLDVLGIERETQATGWRAEILLLLIDEVVVYKLWSGAPNIQEVNTETNPLGPAQDLSGPAANAVRGVIK